VSTEIGILLHEELEGPGVFLSITRKRTDEGWSLEALNLKRVEKLTEVDPTLAVFNDHLAEGLIRQELEQVFPAEEIPQVIEAIRTLSAVFGMPMKSPATV
jgi:hypothetical protein